MLKKKIEKRERKLREMGVDKAQALQRKLHEEGLLSQRFMLFLIFNSILLLGFATLLVSGEAQMLLLTIPSVGILVSAFLGYQAFSVKVELRALDKLLGEKERNIRREILSGSSAGWWMAVFFLVIWSVAITEVVC